MSASIVYRLLYVTSVMMSLQEDFQAQAILPTIRYYTIDRALHIDDHEISVPALQDGNFCLYNKSVV